MSIDGDRTGNEDKTRFDRASELRSPSSRLGKLRAQLVASPFFSAACAMGALVIASAICFGALPRYEAEDRDLLLNRSFSNDLEHWRVNPGEGRISVTGETLSLGNEEPGGFVGIRQPISIERPPPAIRFSARIAGETIVPGAAPSHVGRVYLIVRHGPDDGAYEKHHMLSEVSGTRGWRSYSETIALSERVESISVNLQLRQATGLFEVRAPSLVPLQQRFVFTVARSVLLGCWILVLTWTVAMFWFHTEKPWARWAGLIGLLVLLGGSFAPNSAKRQFVESGPIRGIAAASTHALSGWGFADTDPADSGEVSLSAFENLFHFAMFAALAGFIALHRRSRNPIPQIAWLAVLAAATEAMQQFTDDRDPSLSDWFFDMAGVGVVYAGAFVAGWFRPEAEENRA